MIDMTPTQALNARRGPTRSILQTLTILSLTLLASSSWAQFGGGGGGGGGYSGRPSFGGSSFGGSSQGRSGSGSTSTPSIGNATFEIDPQTGSLIVITDEDTNMQIQDIIDNLDRPAPQVLINVLFLEVTHSDDSDIGVEGSVRFNGPGMEEVVGSALGIPAWANFVQGSVTSTRDGDVVTETVTPGTWTRNGNATGGYVSISKDNYDLTIRALAELGKLEVLSRPSILVRNNEEATITIGREVPFIRNSRIDDDGDIINTIEYEDIGIILEVTPRISPSGLVEMYVYPEISTLTGETVQISETVDAQVIAKRSAETTVIVEDGRTAVIGGMIQDQLVETERKIPLLGDLPLLGRLFRRNIKAKSKTELVIFLTPHVVNTMNDLQAMSIREADKATMTPETFTDEQLDRFIDNLRD